MVGKVQVTMNPCAVHVVNDQVLKEFMGMNLKKALILAKQIKKNYERKYGKTLKITTMSLAVELIGHYAVQEICFWLRDRDLLLRLCERAIRSTEVIDCGEKHCDNNRFVWDILAVPVGWFYHH